MQSVVSMMAILAILIACMGLFGLAAITTESRTKEIGVRKVLGASVSQIMVHLSRNFALLVILAFVIFSPVTYLLVNGWLSNYASRISVQPVRVHHWICRSLPDRDQYGELPYIPFSHC